jgi:hypothetical protein
MALSYEVSEKEIKQKARFLAGFLLLGINPHIKRR